VNRQQRRKAERDAGKGRTTTLLPGDVVFHDTGHVDSGSSAAELPAKVPGQHRWVASAAYVLNDEMVRAEEANQAGDLTAGFSILDHESRFMLAVYCWDCEQPLGAIKAGSTCTAPAGP
jgi:hypothetical protein